MENADLLEIDGMEGEGGGQLVRIAVALAAVTGTPIKIANIRGKRKSKGRKRMVNFLPQLLKQYFPAHQEYDVC